jgi:hypothetical protein
MTVSAHFFEVAGPYAFGVASIKGERCGQRSTWSIDKAGQKGRGQGGAPKHQHAEIDNARHARTLSLNFRFWFSQHGHYRFAAVDHHPLFNGLAFVTK